MQPIYTEYFQNISFTRSLQARFRHKTVIVACRSEALFIGMGRGAEGWELNFLHSPGKGAWLWKNDPLGQGRDQRPAQGL